MVQDLYNVLMGIPDPFGVLGKIVREPPYDRWNRELMISIDLDVLGLEECLRQEQEMLKEALKVTGKLVKRIDELAQMGHEQ